MAYNYSYSPNLPRYRKYSPPQQKPGCLKIFGWYGCGLLLGSGILLCSFFSLLWFFPVSPTNIVLIGLDQRPGEGAVARADTLILTHVNSRKGKVHMLSIPRDLWVTLPDGSENRINTAHFFAENNEPGSGPQAAMQTIADNFNVDVKYYVRINFDGFRQLIDAVGGVEIEVETLIIDDMYPTDDYGIQYVEFQPGLQTLDGEQALQYARIRHGSSDFVRAKRQQQVILAFLSRLRQPLTWLRTPVILTAFQNAVDTNISPLMLARLGYASLGIGTENIERTVLESPYVQGYITDAGASVQLPQWDLIDPLLQENFR